MISRAFDAQEPDRSYEAVLRRKPTERERRAWTARLPARLLRWSLRHRREARELESFAGAVERVLDLLALRGPERADVREHVLDRWRRSLERNARATGAAECDAASAERHARSVEAQFEALLARGADAATKARFVARLCLGLDDEASIAEELLATDERRRVAPVLAEIERLRELAVIDPGTFAELRLSCAESLRRGELPVIPGAPTAERLASIEREVESSFATELARRPDPRSLRVFVARIHAGLDDHESLARRLRALDEHRSVVAPLRSCIDEAYRRFVHRAPTAAETQDAIDRARTTLRTQEELVAALADGTIRRHLGIRPLKLEMDVTTQCNLRCTMCYFSDPRFSKRAREDVDVEAFGRIARDVFPHCGLVSLSFGTEPLLHPRLPELLELVAAESVPWRYLITNAQLLDERQIEAFVRVPLHGFSVSIDAATASTYERIRRGGNWDRLLANLESLQEAKRRARSEYPRITFNFVMMRSNVDELPELVRLAARLGVEGVAAMHLTPFEGLDLEDEQLDREPERSNAILRETRAEAARLGVPVSLPEAFEHGHDPVRALKPAAPAGFLFPPAQDAGSGCPFPRQFIGIDPYGGVVPCGHWYTEAPFGNARESSVLDLWNGTAWRELRDEHATGRLRDTCRACPAAGMGHCDDPHAFGTVRLGDEEARRVRRERETKR